MQVAILILQEALADSQLPIFFIFGNDFNRMLASLEIQLEGRVSQRMLELVRLVSLLNENLLVSTYIFHLVVGVYIQVHNRSDCGMSVRWSARGIGGG